MRLAVVLESDFTAGGGFHQGLNAAQDIHRLASGRHELTVWTDAVSNVIPLQQMGMQPQLFRRGVRDRVLALIELSQLGTRIVAKAQWRDSLEQALFRERIDLVYFASPSPSAARLKCLPFIATVWDLCHRDWPEFPEVGAAGEQHARERLYADCLRRAQVVIADSDQLADNIVRWYGVGRDRLLTMPFGPSPFIRALDQASRNHTLPSYGLQPGYIFYPAQFWPHKNHVRIVQALAQLRDAGLRVVAAFAGADKGNQAHVRALAESLGLGEQVRFLGMVPLDHMRELYEHCAALVMPTYFGPTNLPPLEAWTFGKPVVYSKHLSAHVADAAILVDPDSVESVAAAIRQVVDEPDARDWVRLGRCRLAELAAVRAAAADHLVRHLEVFERRRACWR
jgi:glycosyltransferase involved in cell wall biosynthesis